MIFRFLITLSDFLFAADVIAAAHYAAFADAAYA